MASAGSPIHSIQKKKPPTVGPRARNARPSQLDTTNANCVCGNSDLGASKRKEDDGPGETPTPRCVVACVAHAIIEDLELESPPSTKQKRFSIFFVIEFRRIRITNRLGK